MTAVNEQIVADHHMRVDAVSSKPTKSDPRDESKWSSEDLVTMGFVNTPELMALLDDTSKLADVELDEYDANYVQGGLFKAFVVRDGRLITGQQYSGRKVAQALIEALGI